MSEFRVHLYNSLAPEARQYGGISRLNLFILLLVVVAILIGILSTEPTFLPNHRDLLSRIDDVILIVFAVELVARAWVAGVNPRYQGGIGMLRFWTRPATLTDVVVILPLFLDLEGGWIAVFRIVRVLRLFQLAEMPAAARAIHEFRVALQSHWFELAFAAILGGGLLLGSSVALYLIEGRLQPEVFGSVPRAIWWSVVTFTTVGYGDAVPITSLGRIIAGFHAIAGLAVVAMFTGIVASALTETAEKRDTGPQDEPPAP